LTKFLRIDKKVLFAVKPNHPEGSEGGPLYGPVGNYGQNRKTFARYTGKTVNNKVAEVESAFPTNVKPGDQVELAATYALLDASPDADIKITEIREIRYEGELVGRPKVTLTHKGGTYSSTVPLFLPKDAKTGTYKVIITIQTPNTRDSGEINFTVT